MGVHYIAKNWGQSPFIDQLIRLIMNESAYFRVVAQIIRDYPKPDENEVTKQKREEETQQMLRTKPFAKRSIEEKEGFCQILDQLYSYDPGKHGNIRGDILEAIMYRIGPRSFQHAGSTNVFYEAQILYDGIVLGGESQDDLHDFDFVFHDTAIQEAEYLECKANIKNFVSLGYPPENMPNASKARKWKYMRNVYLCLTETYGFYPKIFIPCFNYESDLTRIQQHFKNHGFEFVEFLHIDILEEMVLNNLRFVV